MLGQTVILQPMPDLVQLGEYHALSPAVIQRVHRADQIMDLILDDVMHIHFYSPNYRGEGYNPLPPS